MNKITDLDVGEDIRITTVDDEEYIGQVDVILWEDETDGEAHLSLDTGERLIGFAQNEIKKIDKI